MASMARSVSTFTVPPKIAAETGIGKLGLVTLRAEEELAVFKRSGRDSAKIALELGKAALVEVDGKKLSLADGSADVFWKDVHPKIRSLVMNAYTKMHANDEEDQESFLESVEVKVE